MGGPSPDLLVRKQFSAGMQFDLGAGHSGPLVGHPELGQAFHLIAPQVDPDRRIVGGRPDVDDRTTYCQLTSMLDLVFASVADSHQVRDERPLVDGVTGSDVNRIDPPGTRAESLDERPS